MLTTDNRLELGFPRYHNPANFPNMTSEVPDPYKWKRGFSREQAADYCAVSIDKVKRAIRWNQLPAVRHGRDIILFREDLDAWMESWEPV